MAERRVTVLHACVDRLGVHRGSLAAANVAQLAIATRELGHFPTAVEYADYWSIDERSAWRHRARARDGLGDDYQDVVVALARRTTNSSPRAVMSLAVPRRVLA